MPGARITVLGATGSVGTKVVRRLLEGKAVVRVVGRDPKKLGALASRGAEIAGGDVGDAAFLARAFRRADAAFVMIPPSYDARDLRSRQNAVGEAQARALREARVPHAVFLSSVGAQRPERTGPILGLHDQEERLKGQRGLNVLALRAAYYMENHLMGIGLVKGQGIYGTALRADLPIPQIATADIAVRAADRLLETSFSGFSAEELLGPADTTMAETAATLGRAIGKPDLPYVAIPYESVEQALLGIGMSPSAAASLVEMHRAFNEGWIVPETPRSPARTTPTTLEEFARTVFAPAFRAT